MLLDKRRPTNFPGLYFPLTPTPLYILSYNHLFISLFRLTTSDGPGLFSSRVFLPALPALISFDVFLL